MSKFFTFSALCALTSIPAALWAAGYQVIEQGGANMGNAMAGATANANNDASAAFWNPSTAAFMNLEIGQTRMDSSVSGIIPTLEFVDNGSTSPIPSRQKNSSCAVNSAVPNFYVVHRLAEDFWATLSVTAPYGLESDYDSQWVGRMQALRSYLFTIDINPSITYKVNDWFSVSGGVSAQYAYCSLSQYVGYDLILSGQSWSVGGNIGFTIQYAPDGRFGFQWRSAVSHTLEGGAHNGDVLMRDISADMSMPDTFTVGIYQRLRGDFKQFAVMAEYAYTRWSVFEELAVKGMGTAPIPENWKDASRVAVGFHYYPEYFKDDLTVRIGASFDESPVSSPQNRTPRIPCSDRVWLSGGLGYKYGPFTFDLAYTYIFVIGNSDINRSEPGQGTVNGSYYAHIHVISGQIGFTF